MKFDDSIPGPVIARNSVLTFMLALAIALISGGAGVLVSRFTNAPADVQAVFGWAILGIVLFGFPIILALMLLRR